MSASHSITALLSGVKKADRNAVHDLFDRYYNRVATMSQRKLARTPRRVGLVSCFVGPRVRE